MDRSVKKKHLPTMEELHNEIHRNFIINFFIDYLRCRFGGIMVGSVIKIVMC